MPPLLSIAIPAAAACAAAAGALAYASIAPSCAFWGPVVQHGDRGGPPRYALTFDDGPSPQSTPLILDTLADLNAKAAFFVIGRNAERDPATLRRMHADGHAVANHSFDHSHFGMMRVRGYWDDQFRRTDALIEELIGLRPALFRPPMGVRTGHIANAARRAGHTLVTWSRRALDGVSTTPDRIVGRLAGSTLAGDILVLHDGVDPNVRHRDPAATVAAIRPLILALRARGLEPARLDELIGINPYAPSRAAVAAE